MNNLHHVAIIVGIKLDKEIHTACSCMAFYHFGNLLQSINDDVMLLWILQLKSDISTCFITNLLGINNEL